MGSIEENRKTWSDWDWSEGGDEWSTMWGGTESMWWGVMVPRLRSFLPTGRVLEIAPGFGRWTQFLKDLCDELVIVDLNATCIDACRSRFAASRHIEYLVNDGQSLQGIADASLDLVFSFDSLVHVEAPDMEAYVQEISRTLAQDGVAFLHHSNMGAHRDAAGVLTVENPDWRAESMTADAMLGFIEASGLACSSQEIVNWGRNVASDCFTVITHPGSSHLREFVRVENQHFMQVAEYLRTLTNVYAKDDPATQSPAESGLLERMRSHWTRPADGPSH